MAARLAAILADQVAQLQQLLELQAREKDFLIKRDAPALDALTQRKEHLLDTIQNLDQQLTEHPQRENISTDSELHQQQGIILDLLEKCQANNEVNGQLVRTTLGRIHHLKQTIQAAYSGTAVTYTNKGKTSSGPSGSSIKA